jgi:hypothetical protein
MGSSSEEPKELVVDVDYWIMRLRKGETAPPFWLARSTPKEITPAVAANVFKLANAPLAPRKFIRQTYLLMKGPKPDKKWGPVCP